MTDRQVNVLYIEDNPADATLVTHQLAEASRMGWDLPHFEIHHVDRLHAAIEHLNNDAPVDVILTDLDLPDKRAAKTFETLHDLVPTTPIVVLTGRNDDELARQTVRAGAEDYLFKQELSGSLLAHALIYAIERRKDKRALQRANETLEARVEARTQELKQANAALRESEKRFRITFEESPVGVTQTAVDGRWIHVNEQFCKITGYPRAELLSMRYQDITHPDDLVRGKALTQRILAGEIPKFSFQKRYIRKDGDLIWVALTSTLVRKPSGEPDYFISVVQDITARKETERALRESEARERARTADLEAIMDAVPAVIWIAHDPQCHLITGNSAAQRLLQMKEEANTSLTPTGRHQPPTHFKIFRDGKEVPPEKMTMQQACRRGMTTKNDEMEVVLEDGTKHILFGNTVPLKDNEDHIRGAIAAYVDVTARKKAMEALRQNEARYRTLTEKAPVGLSQTALDGRFIHVNEQFCTITGYSREQLLQLKWQDITHPDDLTLYQAKTRRLLEGEIPSFYIEKRYIQKDGNILWVGLTISLVRTPSGELDYFVTISQDITDRKEMEAALQASKARYQTLFDASPSPYLVEDASDLKAYLDELRRSGVTDFESYFAKHPEEVRYCDTLMQILDANQAALEFYGAEDKAELLGSLDKILPSDTAPSSIENLIDIAEGKTRRRVEAVNQTLQGEKKEIVLQWAVWPGYEEDFAQVLVVILDMTARKKAEAALLRERERLHMLMENFPDTIYFKDKASRFTRINTAQAQTLGVNDPDEALGKTDFDFFPSDFAEATYEDEQKILQTGKPLINKIEKISHADGSVQWVLATKVPIYDEDGNIMGLAGVSRDITERKRMEDALQTSEAHYRGLFEDAPISLWEEDFSAVKSFLDELRAQGIQDFAAYLDEHPQVVGECLARIRFVDFNKATIDLYHAKSKSTLQQKLDTVLGTKTHPALVKILLAIAQGETQVQAETVNYTVDGTKINVHIDWRVAPGYEATLEKCFVSIKDVTALKTIQTALQRANAELERSNEELERFAYVASHDLREPLRTVTGFLTLLSQNYAAQLTGKAREYVGHALAGAQRMQAMIDALLNLSRVETRGKPLVATDSEAVLSATLNALQARLQETGAEITHDPLPHVMADDAQLGQLFQNLIANALKFRRADVPPKIHLSAEQEGQLWRFSIRDNGIGIAPEESERIFQLFQRLHTEEEYPGLGIGLALCKRIVERHEGQIWMESETGCCTTFYFTLQSGEANQRRET